MKTILLELYDFFITYVAFTNWQQVFGVLKVVSGVFCLGLSFAIGYLVYKIRMDVQEYLAAAWETAGGLPEEEKKGDFDQEAWEKVLAKSESLNENDYKLAVIEADKMFDDWLKKKGVEGEDMGDRLQKIGRDLIPNIDDVWQAHKIRNRIVHESDFHLESYQAKRAVGIYKEAVEKAGIM